MRPQRHFANWPLHALSLKNPEVSLWALHSYLSNDQWGAPLPAGRRGASSRTLRPVRQLAFLLLLRFVCGASLSVSAVLGVGVVGGGGERCALRLRILNVLMRRAAISASCHVSLLCL